MSDAITSLRIRIKELEGENESLSQCVCDLNDECVSLQKELTQARDDALQLIEFILSKG